MYPLLMYYQLLLLDYIRNIYVNCLLLRFVHFCGNFGLQELSQLARPN